MTKEFKNAMLFIAITALFCLSLLWHEYYILTGCSAPERDTVSVRVDSIRDTVTIVKHDTIPKVVMRRVIKYIPRNDVLGDTSQDCSEPTDSMLPVIQKEYTDDSTYTAYVSGIQYEDWPRLDSINVKSRIITNTIDRVITLRESRKSRWNIGIQAGYGYGFLYKGFEPYVGVGVSYRIF